MATETLRPNAAGDYENISSVFGDGVGTHWTTVDEAVADDITTYVEDSVEGEAKDVYNLEATAIPGGSTINSVTVYFRHNTGYDDQWIKPYLRLSGSETGGTQVEASNSSWLTSDEALARPGGGDWTVADLDSLQAGIGIYVDTNGKWVRCTQVYVVIDYTPAGKSTWPFRSCRRRRVSGRMAFYPDLKMG